ncbi:L-aspartate oxidase [Helicobacter monodelphidis]|uniref:L-aspartate oxidase n=1 Tax=Helicobacter sp. 15-1451 TaxID=2004995 RepID=UPI000DCEC347|nr:L-aspartate oxidase [Helicobacter sp. 15-1451]RAX58436.1 L-aspartate oxidase [Helicobacter sp. 15-1451]
MGLNYDVIIIGAGVAGLYTALNIPKEKRVLILCKEQPWECNTFYAQGGIAVAKDLEDIAQHILDTLHAGAGMCNVDSVEILSKESLEILQDLIARHVPFDCDENGKLLFTKEAAHSTNRIIHAGGDCTGRVLHSHLITQIPHTLWKNATVTELLIEENRCYGVSVLTKRGNYNLYAPVVIIASGGLGGLFEYHTNAYTVAGELHGMILEHGLRLKDMEMLQFHPTVFVDTSRPRKPLLSEALRGEGAVIVDENGRRFVFDYDKRGELAPRDAVARAIFDYQQKNQCKVFLDISNFKEEFFIQRFPNIYHNLMLFGFKMGDKIPISPAFHYAMGGIQTDTYGRVKGVENLYALGEAACTGVHGANRLASNSLLEGLVFAKRAALDIINKEIIQRSMREFPLHEEPLEKEQDGNLKKILRNLMWNKVGIIRKERGLNEALGGVEVMLQSNIGRLLRLRLLTAKSIIQSALQREDSIGAHYRQDNAKK